jgi:hypothetical protein
LGLYYRSAGKSRELSQVLWIQKNLPTGGPAQLTERVRRAEPMAAVLAFMLFGPSSGAALDPRAQFPLTYVARGPGHVFSRTGWNKNASFLHVHAGFSGLDHQHADAGNFGWWRKGEWLTKEYTGGEEGDRLTSVHNAVLVQNTPTSGVPQEARPFADAGSQWFGWAAGDAKIVARSSMKGYAYVLADTTSAYNAPTLGALNVDHVSRSVVWLKPDVLVLYDRVETKQSTGFKRLSLNLPGAGSKQQTRVSANTPAGQRLFVDVVVPQAAQIGVAPISGDTRLMTHRMTVTPAAKASSQRFLTVLQGRDTGQAASAVKRVSTSDGDFDGVVVGDSVVFFPKVVSATGKETLSYTLSGSVNRHVICGLKANSAFTFSQQANLVIISPGGTEKSDSAGVLIVPGDQAEPGPQQPDAGPLPRYDSGVSPVVDQRVTQRDKGAQTWDLSTPKPVDQGTTAPKTDGGCSYAGQTAAETGFYVLLLFVFLLGRRRRNAR